MSTAKLDAGKSDSEGAFESKFVLKYHEQTHPNVDAHNSQVYPFGSLNLPLESTEFKFKEAMEWEVSQIEEVNHLTGEVLLARQQFSFLVFIWRKHHHYLMNIIFCDLVRAVWMICLCYCWWGEGVGRLLLLYASS